MTKMMKVAGTDYVRSGQAMTQRHPYDCIYVAEPAGKDGLTIGQEAARLEGRKLFGEGAVIGDLAMFGGLPEEARARAQGFHCANMEARDMWRDKEEEDPIEACVLNQRQGVPLWTANDLPRCGWGIENDCTCGTGESS